MSEFFKNKYKMIAFFTAFILVITLASGAVAYSRKDKLITEGESSELPDESLAEEPDSEPVPETIEVIPQVPSTMRGVFLTPGVDFLSGEGYTEQSVKEEIDAALQGAKDLTMNTVIINTDYEDKVIYHTKDANKVFGAFDIMDYIVKEAREMNFYVFGVLDLDAYKPKAGITNLSVDTASSGDPLVDNVGEYARNYQLDGILLKGYVNQASQDSYSTYSKMGGAIGFDNYMRQTPEMLIQNASRVINTETPVTQIGILADPVWANKTEDEIGSETSASFSALTDGNADTRAFVQNGLVDFIAVNAYGSTTDTSIPFVEVVQWWANLAHESNVPLYVVQSSSKAATDAAGWGSVEELIKQSQKLEEISGVRGSVFDSLQRLLANPDDVSTKLLGYYKEEEEVEEELIRQELEMTKPETTSYTTSEQQVVFTGASDPEQTVTINDADIRRDASGYFTATYNLVAGENTFVITHKEKSVTYSITREINILTEMFPTGNITTDGGMEISISAVAYQDATVSAIINGTQIPLSVDEDVVDESNRDSTFKTFTGKYTAPAATGAEQNLGTVSVTASWGGESKSLSGGSILVNKKAQIEDGVPVMISTDQAKTFPATTLDNIPSSSFFPLPQGAMDYAVGEEIFYKDTGYTVLASGQRVKTSDVTATDDFASSNSVSGLSVDVKDGFTYVRLTTAQKVSYNFSYGGDSVSIRMNNTTSVPANVDLSQNPLFTSATWNDNTLVLSFIKVGGFMGYKGYYDGNDLVFRFNNPLASLSGARVVVDPGHGGKDTGALGFLSDYPEKVLNAAISNRVAEELQARGASVLLLDTSGGMDMPSRVSRAEEFGADLYISVHNNTAPNAAAHGTEVYYHNTYSKNFAAGASSGVSGTLSTNNRGAKQSYYHVTLSSQFPSILVECGFMSNKDEYEKLIRDKYQIRIATGIVDGVANGFAAAYTGVSGGASENTGGSIEVEGKPESSLPESSLPGSSVDSSTAAVTGITLSRNTLQLRTNTNGVLRATITPTNAANQKVEWISSDTTVATVDATGKVTGVKKGTATITAITDEEGFSAKCVVTIVDTGDTGSSSGSGEEIPVTDAFLSDDSIDINILEAYQLTIAIEPNNATNKAVVWKTANPEIATVSNTGLVTGIKDGSTAVTATTTDGGIISTCSVTVGGDEDDSSSSSGESGTPAREDLSKVEYIMISSNTTSMYVSSNQTLSVYSNLDKVIGNTNFAWKSSDSSILSVDRNGVVKAGRKEGTATITASSARYDDLYDSIGITVTRNRVKVTGITLNESSLEINKGGTITILKPTITPSNATNKEISWRVSNSNIASVDSKGIVTAKSIGSTTVIASTVDGALVATCRIDVVGQVTIYDMWIDETIEMSVDSTDTLYPYFDPSNVVNQKVTWSSNNPSVVSVDADGNIKALKEGRARITATYAADPSLTATCAITVY